MSKNKKSVQQKRIALLADYQKTFKSESGKKVLKDLVNKYIYRTSAVQGEPYLTYFNEGQRVLVIDLMKKLKINIHDLYKTLEEIGDEDHE